MLDAYRPGLVFVTVVAGTGLIMTLVPLLRRRAADRSGSVQTRATVDDPVLG
jgi:hypothetical protein